MESKYIVVKGIVQGVGFRPFVYKLALENNLKGNVCNSQSGVYINVEGEKENIDRFIYEIKNNPPKLSKIEEIKIKNNEIKKYNYFKIIDSSNKIDSNYYTEESKKITLLSPDVAICEDCIEDINNTEDQRRYKYAFTNCTNCGPRFSIIKNLPYDRISTSMADFNMCDKCKQEYENPLNRRFHAQPTCCSECGPKLSLLDNNGSMINCNDEIEKVKNLLKEGSIIAIKGLGGFHLVCDATNEIAVQTLRDRKNRKTKPLALMMKDLDTVQKHCYVNNKEKEILIGNKKPILILNKKQTSLPSNISFNNNTLGIMLPYTPLHYLLFDKELEVIVMTSANISGVPIIYNNEKAVNNLNTIADYYLIHNRDIHIPVEDSVVKVILGEERVIRNGRGYCPMSFKKDINSILSLGSNLKSTFSISNNEYIFMSPCIGDMDNLDTIKYYKKNLSHIKKIYNLKTKVIAYDNHPNYWHKEYLEQLNVKKVGVYHHHAHIASCMFENNIDEKVIGISFDGTGYGEDGHMWGSEFLICDGKEFKRVAHLKYMYMPSGDGATKEPWKMGLSLIYQCEDNLISYIKNKQSKTTIYKQYNNIISMIKNNINTPLTSSMGRLFDAVSAILGFDNKVTFEGEACIELENLAKKSINIDRYYNYTIDYVEDKFIIDYSKIIKEIFKDLKNNIDKSVIAMKFHNSVVEFSYEICKKLRDIYNINQVALSGGVFQNDILLINLYNKLKNDNFNVLTHKLIPCNDSGISIGQLIIANERINTE